MKRRQILRGAVSLSALSIASGFAYGADAPQGTTAEMAERYRKERELHAGNKTGHIITADMNRDPWVDPNFKRDPVNDTNVDVVVIGAGFGGVLSAGRLRLAGVKNIRVIDKAGDFGGTWYWNRYPGVMCDAEALCYMPLLEETNYIPSKKYCLGNEIRDHVSRIGKHFDLYKDALFQTRVTGLHWNDQTSRWDVTTDRNDKLSAKFVVTASGPIDNPKLPDIPGIDDYQGKKFHSARWDFKYSGGDTAGGLTGFKDKRVAIIGTSASGIQIIPHLGRDAKEVIVFQRTAQAVEPRNNKPIPRDFAKNLPHGWQLIRMKNFDLASGEGLPPGEIDLVNDGWTEDYHRKAQLKAQYPDWDDNKIADVINFERMEGVRKHIRDTVKNQQTAETLMPYQACAARHRFVDGYYETFNRPNMTVVENPKSCPEKITAKGAIANGKEYEFDVLIFSTGYEPAGGSTVMERQGFDIYGRGGVPLSQKWKDGALTFHGQQTRGFPNLFLVGNAQFGIAGNQTEQYDVAGTNIAYIVKACTDNKWKTVEPTQAAEDEWVAHHVSLIKEASAKRAGSVNVCAPGTQQSAQVAKAEPTAEQTQKQLVGLRNAGYAGGIAGTAKVLEEWRAKGDLSGLEKVSA